jgi:hypothetical protein
MHLVRPSQKVQDAAPATPGFLGGRKWYGSCERLRAMLSGVRFTLAAASPSRFHWAARELRHRFTGLQLQPFNSHHSDPVAEVDLARWRSDSFDLKALDQQVNQALAGAGHCELRMVDRGGDSRASLRAASQVITRFQRFLYGRNRASGTARFDRVLAIHEGLYDRSRPLLAADHDHALDTWQWLLRLGPSASFALQVAALFHDIERLHSEADERVEQFANDYAEWKRAHARTSADITARILGDAGIEVRTVARIHTLVAGHEDPATGTEAQLLADADALSFFSLNSAGFLSYYGAAHTIKKVGHSLARLGARGRRALGDVKLPGDIRVMVEAALDREQAANGERLAL